MVKRNDASAIPKPNLSHPKKNDIFIGRTRVDLNDQTRTKPKVVQATAMQLGHQNPTISDIDRPRQS